MTLAIFESLRIGLVGPLPPPHGGMANQTEQLARLLTSDGAQVELVQVNPPYQPSWVGQVRGARAAFRLPPYVGRLAATAQRVDLFHVMANSGWAWHLFAAPAVWVARHHRIPSIVNYRGGDAAAFLDRSLFWVRPTLKVAKAVVVPSAFLEEVFRRKGVAVAVVPNVIDLERFVPGATDRQSPADKGEVSLLIARNLEPLYDVETALRAFGIVLAELPSARLRVAGSGPDEAKLLRLSRDLGLGEAVAFVGRIPNENMPELYRYSDIVVNPSLVDNMPVSILEALASGVPVVTTNVGGIPVLVEQGRNAVLVPPRDPKAMAEAVLALIRNPHRRAELRDGGIELARRYGWPHVREQWATVYAKALTRPVSQLGRCANV